jgi:hypothetical protein
MATPEEEAAAAAAAAEAARRAAQTPWHAGLDPDIKGELEKHGWQNLTADKAVAEAVKSYRVAASKLGIPPDQVLRFPKDALDESAWKALNQRLGVPDTPEGYDFAAIKNADGSELDPRFVAAMRAAAAQAKLPAPSAQEMVRAEVKYRADLAKEQADLAASTLEAERAKLRLNWGANFDPNLNVAQRAFQRLGIKPETIAALEKADGYASVMEDMRKLGVHLGEARFITGAQDPSQIMSREEAQARLDELKRDEVWAKRVTDGDVLANQELARLIRQSLGPRPQ